MARGNQRDKSREKNMKEQAGQKKKNSQSGTEFQRTKEAQAQIMRQKQEEGMFVLLGFDSSSRTGFGMFGVVG